MIKKRGDTTWKGKTPELTIIQKDSVRSTEYYVQHNKLQTKQKKTDV